EPWPRSLGHLVEQAALTEDVTRSARKGCARNAQPRKRCIDAIPASRVRAHSPTWHARCTRLARAKPSPILRIRRDLSVGDANRAGSRARDHIPHVDVEILREAGHAMGIEAAEPVGPRVVEFLG